jgi:hypothetical protein
VKVWWLNQNDCDAIHEMDGRYPRYLRDQFLSRQGRPGRGRLWADDQFGDVKTEWHVTPLCGLLERQYGGIVIRDEDVELVRELPGIVTDMSLKRIN